MSNYGLACKHGMLAWCSHCTHENYTQSVSGDSVQSACHRCDSLAARVKALEAQVSGSNVTLSNYRESNNQLRAKLLSAERVVEAARAFDGLMPGDCFKMREADTLSEALAAFDSIQLGEISK